MLEKIKKLIESENLDNIELAKNLILTKATKDNAVGIVSMLKVYESNLSDDGEVILKLHNIVSQASSIKSRETSLNVITEKELFSMALHNFQSFENLEWAGRLYKQYINNIITDAMRILEDTELIDDAFEI